MTVAAAAVALVLAVSPHAAHAEEGSASPSPSGSSSASSSPAPSPTSTPAESGVLDTEDPPPSGGALTYSLDADQYAFLQGSMFVLIVVTIAGVVGSWGRRG